MIQCVLFVCVIFSLCASEAPIEVDNTVVYPWLTGPLLSPFGYVIDKGHVNFEPYFYANSLYGRYDSHWKARNTPNLYNLSTQLYTWYGFANRWDIAVAPQFSWNHTSGASHWVLNDIPVLLEYQLVYERPNRWQPAVKLSFLATIPTGKYQKLNPQKKGTDLSGLGSWQPGIEIAFQKLFHRVFVLHYSISYTIPTAVHVKGLNAYGGGHKTRGKVYPGASLLTILGLEFSLSQNWGAALDIQYLHQNRTRFVGRKGTTGMLPNQMGGASNEQLSLAPAIEYSWSSNFGILAGAWFSIAGRNATEFASGIFAINIYK